MALGSVLTICSEAFTPHHHATFQRVRNTQYGHVQTISSRNIQIRLFEDDDAEEDEDAISDEELASTLTEWDNRIARFNTIHVTGRIGGEPEAKYFDDGKVVVNVSLASKRKYVGLERKALNIKAGEEETDWYALEIWGQTAEFVSNYVEKGTRVSVVGSLQVDEWKDKATGEARCRPKIIVRDIDVLESKAEAELRRSGGGSKASQFFD